jgi:hypothetical protein
LTRRLIAPLALAAGMAFMTGAVLAQPGRPDKGDKKKGDKKDFKKGDKKGPFGEKKEPPKADPTVEAWLKVVLEKITDPHDVVRDSARDAVISVGPRAIPALEKLARGNDDAKAEAARRLIHAIHFHHGPGMRGMHDMRGEGPHHPGFGMHTGPHHFGHPGMGGGFGRGGWGRGHFGPMGHGPMGKGPKEKGSKDKEGKDKGERKRDEQGSLDLAPMPHVASR